MFEYIETLRKKPVAYRKRVLFISTVGITAVIFFIWLSTFRLTSDISEADSLEVAKQLKPIDEIISSVGEFFGTVKDFGIGLLDNNSSTTQSQ